MKLSEYLQQNIKIPEFGFFKWFGRVILVSISFPVIILKAIFESPPKKWTGWLFFIMFGIFLLAFGNIIAEDLHLFYRLGIYQNQTLEPVLKISVIMGVIYVMGILFTFLISILSYDRTHEKLLKQITNAYPSNSSAQQWFSSADYEEAARILKLWKATPYKKAIKKFSKKAIDILVLTGCIMNQGSKNLIRIICLKCIEEGKEECLCRS